MRAYAGARYRRDLFAGVLASPYFYASVPSQFDAMIHFDQTRAVKPLELSSEMGDR